ncbi:MAG: hypothetical protein V5A52_01720 [Halovenus sp.]|uniref:DUF5789 family protein n=1 Tax=Halovenus amylolytica TaxID=2500550 RepID=UPI000FE2D735
MGVRPPSNGTGTEPDAIEFGIAALDARLDERNVSFPVSAADLDAAHGDLSVAVDASGTEITLSDALAACDQHSFDSQQDLLNALHPVFEAKRESSGILDRLRSLVPF